MNNKLIAAGLIALASGTAAASTSLSIPNATDAYIDIVGQSVFESVVKITPSSDLTMSFSALDGAFRDVSYTFYTDASLTKTLTGDDWSVWTISGSGETTSGTTSFAKGSSLDPFVASVFGLTLSSGTTYFVKFSGTLTSASGELKVTVGNGVVAAVPEPESYAMLLAGLGLMAAVARRRNRALQD